MKTCYVLAAWMVLVPFFLQAQPEHEKSANAGMVPRENLEESVVRTGRDFPAGGNPCLSKGLTSVHASVNNPCHPGLFRSL